MKNTMPGDPWPNMWNMGPSVIQLSPQIVTALERIASAAERIADALEAKQQEPHACEYEYNSVCFSPLRKIEEMRAEGWEVYDTYIDSDSEPCYLVRRLRDL